MRLVSNTDMCLDAHERTNPPQTAPLTLAPARSPEDVLGEHVRGDEPLLQPKPHQSLAVARSKKRGALDSVEFVEQAMGARSGPTRLRRRRQLIGVIIDVAKPADRGAEGGWCSERARGVI